MDETSLVFYVVYDHPSDYPDMWVVRRQIVTNGNIMHEPRLWAQAGTLEEVRESIPRHLYRMPRDKDDDRAIHETWF